MAIGKLYKNIIIASGREYVASQTDSVTTVTVTFPSGLFPSVPIVMATNYMDSGDPGSAYLTYSISSVSRTGFTIKVYNKTGGTKSVFLGWLAILEP